MEKRKAITPIYPYDPLDEYRVEVKTTNKTTNKISRLLIVAVCLTVVATVSTIVYSTIVIKRVFYTMNLRNEYSDLFELTQNIEAVAPYEPNIESNDKSNEESNTVPHISEFDTEMRLINSDYLCWLKVDGTSIDYPVVRSNDNEKYLDLSFYGEKNVYGTLFMDYRSSGEYIPHIIIYGHNMMTGDMFGGLRRFLDDQYLQEHNIITIKANDRIIEYEIFAARKTDINDPAYYLDFSTPGSFSAFLERCSAPRETTQIITLSTCVSGNDKDERVIVQAALR